MTVFSFVVFMIVFLAIGLGSAWRAKKSRNDYYLASRSVSPWLVALSAVATNNSGYMFIGVIGFTYTSGFAAVWLMIGWLVGDFISSMFIHQKLRAGTERTNEASFASVLARWSGQDFNIWRRIAALIMVAFLGSYAAAQIAAGGKALQGVLGWYPETGAVLVAVMVLGYSIAGGIRASIWTDAAQSIVMIIAMTVLFIAGVQGMGGIGGSLDKMGEIPGFLDLYPGGLWLPGLAGLFFFVLGWLFAGASVIGQPQIMVRFMALDDEKNMLRARVWYYVYFVLFYFLATGVGLLSRLYLPDLGALDPELALPTMATELLPPIMVGMILAGIFAATMSTADSLVLSCSAAITHDLVPQRLEHPWLLKAATAAVTGLALIIALSEASSSVFALVILSWSTLASAFAPLLILYAFNRQVPEMTAIGMMALGVAIAIGWRMVGLHTQIYEGTLGILVPLALGWVLSRPMTERELRHAPIDTSSVKETS